MRDAKCTNGCVRREDAQVRWATMLTLYKCIPAWGLPDISPFCFKLETYLRMAGIPYTPAVGDARKAPKKKVPFIEHDGRTVADSTAIIAYLKEVFGDPLDGHLGARERALAEALRAMLEEHLYFVVLYQRWIEDEGWAKYRPVFAEYARNIGVPGLLMPIALASVRRQCVAAIRGQGTGRHSPAEVVAVGKRLFGAVSELLGDKPYVFGDRASSIDATTYAFTASVLMAPFESALKEYGLSLGNLAAYCERMKAAYSA
jgi:glutathione S-transferase